MQYRDVDAHRIININIDYKYKDTHTGPDKDMDVGTGRDIGKCVYICIHRKTEIL